MGAVIRAYDWDNSPLGPSEHWPQSLRVVVRLMLDSRHPMLIWWGPELIQFYNDAHITLMDPGRHPSALGGSGRDFCADFWDIVGPQIEHVMAGNGATGDEDCLMPVTRGGRRENAWWSYSYAPIDCDGRVGGVLAMVNNVTAQHLTNETFKSQTRQLTQLFEQAPGYMAVLRGPEHVFEFTNAAYRRLIGDRDFIGRPMRKIVPEIVPQGGMALLDEAYRTGKPYVGRRVVVGVRPDAEGPLKKIFADFVFQPIREANGNISGVFVAGVDITDHVHAEQHLQLMNAELQHRVKNTLSIIGAIASQTLHRNLTDATLEAFQDRLAALGRAQDILTGTSLLPTASVRDVVENALAPYRTGTGRISISGPDIIVGSKRALSLGMAIHEMATNAIKYGALSNDLGRIDISWRLKTDNGERSFHFLWRESGGPPVARPSRKGFGSSLIEGGLAWDFQGRVDVGYEPSGFTCRLNAPLENLGKTAIPRRRSRLKPSTG